MHLVERIELINPSRGMDSVSDGPLALARGSSLPLFVLDMVPTEALPDHISPLITHPYYPRNSFIRGSSEEAGPGCRACGVHLVEHRYSDSLSIPILGFDWEP
jgi:hypothetical protein